MRRTRRGITDADGLGNVVYEYQWVRRDGTEEVDIAGGDGCELPAGGGGRGADVAGPGELHGR